MAIKNGTIATYTGSAHRFMRGLRVRVNGPIIGDDGKPTGYYDVSPWVEEDDRFSWVSSDAKGADLIQTHRRTELGREIINLFPAGGHVVDDSLIHAISAEETCDLSGYSVWETKTREPLVFLADLDDAGADDLPTEIEVRGRMMAVESIGNRTVESAMISLYLDGWGK